MLKIAGKGRLRLTRLKTRVALLFGNQLLHTCPPCALCVGLAPFAVVLAPFSVRLAPFVVTRQPRALFHWSHGVFSHLTGPHLAIGPTGPLCFCGVASCHLMHNRRSRAAGRPSAAENETLEDKRISFRIHFHLTVTTKGSYKRPTPSVFVAFFLNEWAR